MYPFIDKESLQIRQNHENKKRIADLLEMLKKQHEDSLAYFTTLWSVHGA